MARIFVTQPLAEPGMTRLKELGDTHVFPDSSRICPRDVLLREVAEAEVLCCLLHDRIDAEVIDAGKNLRLVASGAIQPANIDVERARARGITITTIPNIVAETTADMQWALMLAAARRVVEADRGLRSGIYPGSQSLHYAGAEIHGKVLGTVGLGAIGRGTVRRAHGFGMQVLYTKPRRLSPAEEEELGVTYRPFDDLLRESDFVVLNAAYTPETHHLIGAREFSLMKPTAVFVNTSRGPMVDEAALVEALRERRIQAAGIDVYEREPEVHPGLIALDNVVLTPHLGSASRDTRAAIATVVADNVEAFLAGRRPPNVFGEK